MISRTPEYALVAEGEKWTCRICPGCRERRMMPESERGCLRCQETGGRKRRAVLRLPNLRAARDRA